jgi:hypothetical protein
MRLLWLRGFAFFFSYLPPKASFLRYQLNPQCMAKLRVKYICVISMQIMIENRDICAPNLQINEVYDFEIVILNHLLIF